MGENTTKTNAQKQADFRARNKKAGRSEVRGVIALNAHHAEIRLHAREKAKQLEEAPPDDHPTIREAAKRLADRLAKKRKPTTPTKG